MKPTSLPVTCADCAGSLREVLLFGKSDASAVQFADAKEPRNWVGMFKMEGKVRSLMCNGCGRLFLYGVSESHEDD